MVELAQKVENDYIGSPCGQLDQIMIYYAKAGMGHAPPSLLLPAPAAHAHEHARTLSPAAPKACSPAASRAVDTVGAQPTACQRSAC